MTGIPSERSLALQFHGFLQTPALWNNREFLDIPQFFTKQIPPEIKAFDLNVPSNLILGRRVEYFFQYYIEQFSNEEILLANAQITSKKTTIGELDFLLRNRSSQSISHVELVYKFYLYDPSIPSETDGWIGPNKRDSLVKKLKKLQEHQLPLLYRPETRPLLEQLQIRPEEVGQKVCYKANLFVPYSFLEKSFSRINPECLQGFWIKSEEFTEEEFGNHLFYSPKKADWPVSPEKNTCWFSFDRIREQLSLLLDQGKSPLVWMKKDNGEYQRFFLVWW